MSRFKFFKNKIQNFLDAKLPFEIIEAFSGLEIKYVNTYNKKAKLFKEVNEKKIKINLSTRFSGYIVTLFSLAAFFFFSFSFPKEEFLTHPGITIMMVIVLVFILSLSYAWFAPQKHIILNRETGVFTFPHRTIGNHYVSDFNKVTPFWLGTGGVTGNLNMKLVAQHPDSKLGGANLIAHVIGCYKIWSFYVWYMDKNRPLPPGTAFDPYRAQDFERRKAAGFPAPLYLSRIPTPEATPEQQAEREQYWKDNDYMISFDREHNAILYDAKVHTDWARVRCVDESRQPFANTWFRYAYADQIIYMKTDEDGFGFQPPSTINYKSARVV